MATKTKKKEAAKKGTAKKGTAKKKVTKATKAPKKEAVMAKESQNGASGQTDVKNLIDLGKKKGFLTYEEVNDVLPANVTSPEAIDDIMVLFKEMDIQILDSESAEKRQIRKKEEPTEEEEGKEDKRASSSRGIASFDDSESGIAINSTRFRSTGPPGR